MKAKEYSSLILWEKKLGYHKTNYFENGWFTILKKCYIYKIFLKADEIYQILLYNKIYVYVLYDDYKIYRYDLDAAFSILIYNVQQK